MHFSWVLCGVAHFSWELEFIRTFKLVNKETHLGVHDVVEISKQRFGVLGDVGVPTPHEALDGAEEGVLARASVCIFVVGTGPFTDAHSRT